MVLEKKLKNSHSPEVDFGCLWLDKHGLLGFGGGVERRLSSQGCRLATHTSAIDLSYLKDEEPPFDPKCQHVPILSFY